MLVMEEEVEGGSKRLRRGRGAGKVLKLRRELERREKFLGRVKEVSGRPE